MAMTFAQTALTPTSPQIPSLAALGNPTIPQLQQSPLQASPLDPSAPPITGVYVDEVTGQLMIPGAKGTPAVPRPAGYDRNIDPGWFRPDSGGR